MLCFPALTFMLQDITTAKGEEQCDEDDYGYESNMSQQIFNKLANRYATMPEDDKLKFVHSKKGNIDDIKVSDKRVHCVVAWHCDPHMSAILICKGAWHYDLKVRPIWLVWWHGSMTPK